MTVYAPNTGAPPPDKEYAQLSSGLLARKGQALPAVDAQMHEGVDINFAMNSKTPRNAPRPAPASEDTISALNQRTNRSKAGRPRAGSRTLRRGNDFNEAGHGQNAEQPVTIDAEVVSTVTAEPAAWRALAPPSKPIMTEQTTPEPEPQSTHTPPQHPEKVLRDDGKAPPMATVKFRLPARDFIRMRLASRDMEISGAALIREALDCYLEANAIDDINDEQYANEMAQLRALMKRRRGTGAA